MGDFHRALGRRAGAVALLCTLGFVTACGDDDSKDTETQTDACSGKMFEKYGAPAFVAVRDSIVNKALAAPTDKLGDSFQSFVAGASASGVQNFKDNLAAFLVMVYGGPKNYKGRTMEAAHAGLAITSDQYDYFIAEVVVPALAENGVPSDDITMCFAPPVTDPAFKASIVGQ